MNIEVTDRRKSEECGCPEEDYIIGIAEFTAHLEPDGSANIFAYVEEFEYERTYVDCGGTIEGMRRKALEWARELHTGDQR